MWRENPQIGRDLATLVGSGAHVIGINEGAGWTDETTGAATRAGYRVVGDQGDRAHRQNPILTRGDIAIESWSTVTTSRKVGSSPERTATLARLMVADTAWTVINTHANSHVQAGAAKPHALPRVREYVRGSVTLANLVRVERAAGRRVIVLGDLNWSWSSRAVQWRYSPVAVFRRLGMVSQYDAGMLPRPKGDRRPIEYVLWHPTDAAFTTQAYLGPEKSDHPWFTVTLQPKETP